jgi:hypothetical protein
MGFLPEIKIKQSFEKYEKMSVGLRQADSCGKSLNQPDGFCGQMEVVNLHF